ncbi:GH19671, partial [Drosophila grimshawi]
TLEALQKQLEDVQSQFLQRTSSCRQQGQECTYKLVTIVHADNCKLLLHPDDLLELPKNIPAKSANDFKHLCHEFFESTLKSISEQIMNLELFKDDITGAAVCETLRVTLQEELNDKLLAVDAEIMRMCSGAPEKIDVGNKNSELHRPNSHLQLENENKQLKKQLEASEEKRGDLVSQLTQTNILLKDKIDIIADQQTNMNQLKQT